MNDLDDLEPLGKAEEQGRGLADWEREFLRGAKRAQTEPARDEEEVFPAGGDQEPCSHCAGLASHWPCCPIGVAQVAARASSPARWMDVDPVAACEDLARDYEELERAEPGGPLQAAAWAAHWRQVAGLLRTESPLERWHRETALEYLARPLELPPGEAFTEAGQSAAARKTGRKQITTARKVQRRPGKDLFGVEGKPDAGA